MKEALAPSFELGDTIAVDAANSVAAGGSGRRRVDFRVGCTNDDDICSSWDVFGHQQIDLYYSTQHEYDL